MTTELDLARQMADGTLQGVVPCGVASWLVALRVSGSGVAWRPGHQEFCYRSKAVWLSDEMVERVGGVPLLVGHPSEGSINDINDFADRVVGVLLCGAVRNDELWAAGRVFDRELAELIARGAIDTSPCATFEPGATSAIRLPTGEQMIIEGNPSLLDHLACVAVGVWSKGITNSSGNRAKTEENADA